MSQAADAFPGFASHDVETSRGAVRAVVGGSGPPRFYGDPLEVWRPWAPEVRGAPVDASHFMAEDRPDEVAGALLDFLSG